MKNLHPPGARQERLRAKLHHLIPGGCHTYSKGDDVYPANAPAVLARGKGAWVWDVEGRRFLDTTMGLRSVIIGHAAKEPLAAVRKWLPRGANLSRPTELEARVAELMVSLIPSAEMVKFAKNGSTVTTAAVKLARAFTGRDLVACCRQHPFFSYDDWFIGKTASPAGVPEAIERMTLVFDYNDLESAEKLFREYAGRIAAVILEPATSDLSPAPGFLEGLRALCDAHGTVLIFDEMITGFRWHIRGAQRRYGVTPDLSTFGKGIANGFSVAALAGRREIMRLGGDRTAPRRVFLISTTHGAETHALAAAEATILHLKKVNGPLKLEREGQRWIAELNRAAREEGVADHLRFYGEPCSPAFDCLSPDGKPDLAFKTLFLQEMAARGVLFSWISLALAHGERERRFFVAAFRESARVYRAALSEGVERHLKVPPIRPVFRAEP